MFIKGTKGKCGAAKAVIRDVLSRSGCGAPGRSGHGGDREEGECRGMLGVSDGGRRSPAAPHADGKCGRSENASV